MPNFPQILQTLKARFRSTRRAISKFMRPQSFSIPSKSQIYPRIKHNTSHFKLHYVVLLWVSLLVSLYSHHKSTMLFLMAGSKVAIFYEVLMKMVPGGWKLVRKVLDRRLIVGMFVGAMLVEIVVTGAATRVAVAAGVGGPIVLLHAVFRTGDDSMAVNGSELDAEVDPIGEKKEDSDLEDGKL